MKIPRWGFRIGWDDFVVGLRSEAQRYGLRIDDSHFQSGIVPLPDSAVYDGWDLRALASHCRDLEPHEWLGAIRAHLFEVYGRAGELEVVAAAPPTARVVKAASVVTKPTTTFPDRLRAQVFGDAFVAARALDIRAVAMQELGDAWLVLVEDRGGGAEAVVTWDALKANAIARDAAFALALRQALADTAPAMQQRATEVPGAAISVMLSAGKRYVGACMLELLARRTAPCIVAPLSWLHWVVVELAPGAIAATLPAVHDVVEPLRAQLAAALPADAHVTPTYWWWQVGEPPEPFAIDGVLPLGLERALTS